MCALSYNGVVARLHSHTQGGLLLASTALVAPYTKFALGGSPHSGSSYSDCSGYECFSPSIIGNGDKGKNMTYRIKRVLERQDDLKKEKEKVRLGKLEEAVRRWKDRKINK